MGWTSYEKNLNDQALRYSPNLKMLIKIQISFIKTIITNKTNLIIKIIKITSTIIKITTIISIIWTKNRFNNTNFKTKICINSL